MLWCFRATHPGQGMAHWVFSWTCFSSKVSPMSESAEWSDSGVDGVRCWKLPVVASAPSVTWVGRMFDLVWSFPWGDAPRWKPFAALLSVSFCRLGIELYNISQCILVSARHLNGYRTWKVFLMRWLFHRCLTPENILFFFAFYFTEMTSRVLKANFSVVFTGYYPLRTKVQYQS